MNTEVLLRKGTATRKFVISAVLGLVLTTLLVLAVGGGGIGWAYVLAGPFYGVGLAFATWREALEATKRSTVQGVAGLGIGIILSRWLGDSKWGIFGWLYCAFKIAWHLGVAWIPGVAYAFRAVGAEWSGRDARAEILGEPQPAAPRATGTPAASPAPRPATAAPRAAAATPRVAPAPAPVPAPADHAPVLACLAGPFAGAGFPLRSGETVYVGSDPSRCQVVLPSSCVAPVHCAVRYAPGKGGWQISDFTTDGTSTWMSVAKGSVVTVGTGADAARFRLD